MNKNDPIAVFDSGVGGISVLKELLAFDEATVSRIFEMSSPYVVSVSKDEPSTKSSKRTAKKMV